MTPNYRTLLKEQEHNILIIHYSCSSIREIPCRISCIGVRDEFHNETRLFSLRRFSEEEMLEKAWRIIAENKEKYFIGWNIKNPEFGLNILKERYEEISRKKAPKIKTSNIVDLDEAIKRIYGLKRQKLTLKKLAEINGYQTLHFRSGKEELRMFKENDFKGLELSVGRKVKVIGDILNDFVRGKLVLEPKLQRKFWSTRKIVGLFAYILICMSIDWILFPIIELSVVGLIAVETAILLGFPKLLDWLRNKSK